MTETRIPIGETGRVNAHEVGALEATIGMASVSLHEMSGEEETEAGTIDEMLMRTAIGGDSGMSDDQLEQTQVIHGSRCNGVHALLDLAPAFRIAGR